MDTTHLDQLWAELMQCVDRPDPYATENIKDSVARIMRLGSPLKRRASEFLERSEIEERKKEFPRIIGHYGYLVMKYGDVEIAERVADCYLSQTDVSPYSLDRIMLYVPTRREQVYLRLLDTKPLALDVLAYLLKKIPKYRKRIGLLLLENDTRHRDVMRWVPSLRLRAAEILLEHHLSTADIVWLSIYAPSFEERAWNKFCAQKRESVSHLQDLWKVFTSKKMPDAFRERVARTILAEICKIRLYYWADIISLSEIMRMVPKLQLEVIPIMAKYFPVRMRYMAEKFPHLKSAIGAITGRGAEDITEEILKLIT